MVEQARVTMKHRVGRPGSLTVFNVSREHSNHSFHGGKRSRIVSDCISVRLSISTKSPVFSMLG